MRTQIAAAQSHLVFKNCHCVLPEDGAHVPKHVEAHLMFCINIVHVVDIISGVCGYKTCTQWTALKLKKKKLCIEFQTDNNCQRK